MIVAIDGPAGAGKSTTARELAKRLGWAYVDTGAMYRTLALAAAECKALNDNDECDEATLEQLARSLDLRFAENGTRVYIGERDVSEPIRTPENGARTSKISALPSVRAVMVEMQRRIARDSEQFSGGAVLEGRDIQTVVFPQAEVKVFLTADSGTRAARRLDQWNDTTASQEAARRDIEERDQRDSSRTVSPLKAADDAVVIHTDELTPDEVVETIVQLVRERQTATS